MTSGAKTRSTIISTPPTIIEADLSELKERDIVSELEDRCPLVSVWSPGETVSRNVHFKAARWITTVEIGLFFCRHEEQR